VKAVILDTNAYSSFMLKDPKVEGVLERAEEVWMSAIVLGELHAGFRGGTKIRWNQDLLDGFLAKPRVQVLDATAETAEIYGRVKADLARAGTPIPVVDVWIAAHALQTGSVLVSYDRRFLKVAGLRVWDELEPV
jgi:tRNA(fMet)-specific endonuclease VapC